MRGFAFLGFVVMISCKSEPQPPGSKPAASASAPASAAPPKVSAVAPKPPPPVLPPELRPTLAIKVSPAGEPKRADTATKLEKVYAAIEEIANAEPAGCAIELPGCKKRFELFASDVARLRKTNAAAGYVVCPKGAPKTADDLAIEQMAQKQISWLSRWIDDVEAIGRAGYAGNDSAWEELKIAAEKQHPLRAPSCAP